MNLKLKVQIANLTTGVMIATIVAIMLWFVGFIIAVTLKLNVFDEQLTTFLIAALGGAFVLVACSAILNVSINISIIADKYSIDIAKDSTKVNYKKILVVSGVVVVATIALLVLGNFYSYMTSKSNIQKEANDIVSRYDQTINRIGINLSDLNNIKLIPDDLIFLSKIKKEYPSVFIIVSSDYNKQMSFVRITQFTSSNDLMEKNYGNSYYECDKNDCNYLTKVFKEKYDKQNYIYKENDYTLYLPVHKYEKSFVLVFTKYERYGKVGSYRETR